MLNATAAERFSTKYDVAETGCWTWKAARWPNGYGAFGRGGKGGMTYAHRASYELHVGPIPDGLCIDHLCRVRHCVNPAHLEAVTGRENARRGVRQRHIVNERCADCQSTRGKIRTVKGGVGWVCHDCEMRKTRARRAKRKAEAT